MALLLKEKKHHHTTSFQDVKEATKNFTEAIGRGGYGLVYKGQLSISGKLTTVAVKKLQINNKSGQGLKEFLNEINLLSDLKHPNIVSLLSVSEEGDKKVLIYEYASNGSLDRYLTMPKTPCKLTWKERIRICIDAAQGLDYLHNKVAENHRIIHRDIKSSNILLDENMKAVISDLGLSKIGRANELETYLITGGSGTHGYCDPVYISSGILTKESDIYSFGVVLFEVLSGRLCIIDVHNEQRFLAHLAKKYFKEEKADDIVEPDLKDQINSNSLFTFLKIAYDCLHEDRDTRPRIAMVVRTLKDALKFQENGEKGLSSMNNEAYTKRDEFYKLPSKKDNVNTGNMMNLFQGNWTPISLPESWDQDFHPPNQSNLRVSTDKDLLVKCLSILKKLLENNGGNFEDSYIKHWVDIVELFKEVSNSKNDSSGRVLYESVSCITIVVSRVAQVVRASLATKHTKGATNGLQEILDHAKASGVVDALLSCLVTCGTSLMSESPKLLHAACEACEAIWSLIDAFEIQSSKEIAPEFPLRSMYSHSVDQLNTKEDESQPLVGKDSEEIVEAVTQAFLKSEAVQIAMFYCLRQHANASWWSSVIQILLRCCLRSVSVACVVCGISNSSVVSGGGDNTIVSEVFSIISLCASFDRDPQLGDTNSLKSKISDPSALISHSCLFVTSVAQSLDSVETRSSAIVMITSSPETQQSRLSDLAHHYSLCDEIQNFQPHSMSAMRALASILSLENEAPTERSISEITFPLIPQTATLFDYLKLLTTDAEKDKTSKLMFSYLLGFRDVCVCLLAYRLQWGGSPVIQDFVASDIPQTLLNLLEDKHSDEIGLSPGGVGWTLNLLLSLITYRDPVFGQLLLTREYAKVMCDLISDIHLKLTQHWGGLGGGKIVGGIVAWVSMGLEYPFIENRRSPDWKDWATEITTMEMEMYIQVLVELGLAEKIIKCLEHLELKYTKQPVSLVARMISHQSLAVELRDKGFLSPNITRRLLDDSTPIDVTLNVVIIVSELAKMDEEYCEHINGIDILEKFKRYLTHEDPVVRVNTLIDTKYMFREKSNCYSFLAKHNIISLLVDRLYDEDDTTLDQALDTIYTIVYHGDLFYGDLRICIPQLAKLLLSAEHNRMKYSAAICLNILSAHSDKLSQDMISQGAMEALFKVVADCYDFALDPNKIDAIKASPLYSALRALATMCRHLILRQFIRSSKVYPIIGELRQSPVEDIASYASLIFNRISEQ